MKILERWYLRRVHQRVARTTLVFGSCHSQAIFAAERIFFDSFSGRLSGSSFIRRTPNASAIGVVGRVCGRLSMGNLDRWSTPKQIKIERAGEPGPLRRGPLKKGQRRKGIKARLDELKSSKTRLERYAEYMLDEKRRRLEHPEWYTPHLGFVAYDPQWGEHFDRHEVKHKKLLVAALNDGVITSVAEWLVRRP